MIGTNGLVVFSQLEGYVDFVASAVIAVPGTGAACCMLVNKENWDVVTDRLWPLLQSCLWFGVALHCTDQRGALDCMPEHSSAIPQPRVLMKRAVLRPT